MEALCISYFLYSWVIPEAFILTEALCISYFFIVIYARRFYFDGSSLYFLLFSPRPWRCVFPPPLDTGFPDPGRLPKWFKMIPSCIDLGNIGSNMVPNWSPSSKHGSKCPKLLPKWLRLGPPWGYVGQTLPKAPQMSPTCIPNVPKMIPNGSKLNQKWSKNDPKTVLLNIGIDTLLESQDGKNIGLGTTWNCLRLLGRRVESQ